MIDLPAEYPEETIYSSTGLLLACCLGSRPRLG
jgi:hypothetical protein